MCTQLPTCVMLSISGNPHTDTTQRKKSMQACSLPCSSNQTSSQQTQHWKGTYPQGKLCFHELSCQQVKQSCLHGLHSVQNVQVLCSLTTPKTSLFPTGHWDLAGFSSRSETFSSDFQLNIVNFWLNYTVKEKQITTSQFWFLLSQPGHLTGCQHFWTFKLQCVLQLWLLPSYSWRFQE